MTSPTITLQITVCSVYGRNVAYPANGAAESLAAIAGTKTLTRMTLALALEMGCTLQVLDQFGGVAKTFNQPPQSNELATLSHA